MQRSYGLLVALLVISICGCAQKREVDGEIASDSKSPTINEKFGPEINEMLEESQELLQQLVPMKKNLEFHTVLPTEIKRPCGNTSDSNLEFDRDSFDEGRFLKIVYNCKSVTTVDRAKVTYRTSGVENFFLLNANPGEVPGLQKSEAGLTFERFEADGKLKARYLLQREMRYKNATRAPDLAAPRGFEAWYWMLPTTNPKTDPRFTIHVDGKAVFELNTNKILTFKRIREGAKFYLWHTAEENKKPITSTALLYLQNSDSYVEFVGPCDYPVGTFQVYRPGSLDKVTTLIATPEGIKLPEIPGKGEPFLAWQACK